jgi:trans-2,3-dihydro-3-hydroxyanthranilate isomerase
VASEHAVVQVDVFTDRVFGGNPLAVVLDAATLSGTEMQAIAGEMNLSETTFLLPPDLPECAARVRIFTPAREVPFAGHPTLGTAWVLAAHGLLPPGTAAFALQEGIGAVPVTLEGKPDNPAFLWMGHRPATFGPAVGDRAAVARALGLEAADLRPGVPVEFGSTGNPFLFIALRDAAAVDRAALDVAAAIEGAGPTRALGVFVFAPPPDPGAPRVYARMFAPRSGVVEDPATGSAAGPLGAFLVRHGLVAGPGEVAIVCEQGVRMGRPSVLHVRLRARPDGGADDIRVGGAVVPVLEGRLDIP